MIVYASEHCAIFVDCKRRGMRNMRYPELNDKQEAVKFVYQGLMKTAWGKGYATEAAKACLGFAFSELDLNEIYSFATINNKGSEAIMKKIGMNYIDTFNHPSLINHKELEECLVYKVYK